MKDDLTNYLALGVISILTLGGVFMIANLDSTTGQAYKPINSIKTIDLCGNGVCDPRESLSNCPTDCPIYCMDSDYGISVFEKGFVKSNKGEYQDHCMNNGNLVEYYCQGVVLSSWPTICTNGCIDGICIESQPNSG